VILLIKPSKDSVKKAKMTIKEVFARKRGRPVGQLIYELNPIIRGIGYYWRPVVSKNTIKIINGETYMLPCDLCT